MGTYFSHLTGMPSSICESANISQPEIIKKIHKEYIKAGARLIRTNTFSANTVSSKKPLKEVLKLIISGYRLALESAAEIKKELNISEDIIVAADVGPIHYEDKNNDAQLNDSIMNEYKRIIDAFLEQGADLFIFETFPETCHVNEISRYIKIKRPDSTIIASFSFTPEGYTRKGVFIEKIIDELDDNIDVFGLNCGSGPTHMDKLLNSILEKTKNKNLAISCMPNSGYAAIENNRTIYRSSPEYFAEIVSQMASKGAHIIGGCCGTTPEHIDVLYENIIKVKDDNSLKNINLNKVYEKKHVDDAISSNFSYKINNNEFVLLAELTPPSNSDLSKLIKGAREYKNNGIDIVTISDSPLARVKMDSIIASARVSREAGIETLPHLCCRDRNINSLRSAVIGAHTEGIRAILAVTGDAVPENERPYVKSVFNVSSIKLIQIIQEMNNNFFKGDEFIIGGALNPAAVNKNAELRRSMQKIENGCSFFLTQPVFNVDELFLIKEIRKFAKVLVGIMPIVSYRNAMYLKNEVPGFDIPDSIVSCFTPDMTKEKAVEAGIRIAGGLAEKVRDYADGFYFVTPFNRSDIICKLLNMLRDKDIV